MASAERVRGAARVRVGEKRTGRRLRAGAVAVSIAALIAGGGTMSAAAATQPLNGGNGANGANSRSAAAATAKVAGGSFSTSFEANDPDPHKSLLLSPPTNVTGFATTVGAGPTSGPNMKAGAGFTGLRALRYSGSQPAAGAATATDVLFDGLTVPIGSRTQLSYKVFPQLAGDLSYPATDVAVDLVLGDGTRISDASYSLVDGHGGGVSARAQGTSKILYADQWNSVKIDLGSLQGKTISKVLFTYDNPSGAKGTAFTGWLDDLSLADAPVADTSAGLVGYVDTRRGTNSSGSFSRGNNIPAAAMPNGFNFWTPMTDAASQSWLYNYASTNDAANLPKLQGIGVSHEPSPWMGDRNQLAILPSVSGSGATAPDATLTTRALEFSHSDEVARPDLYSVRFTNGMKAEVAPTDHAAVMRFTFTGATGSVLVDQVAGTSGLTVARDGTVSGWVDGGSGLSVGASRMFVSGRFDRAALSSGAATGDRTAAKYATFDTSKSKTVTLRLATSFISAAQATKNLDLEVTGKSFATVQKAAAAAWNARLGVITLGGATADQLATTYGSLYRLNMYPNSQFENVGTVAKPVYEYASPVAPQQGTATATTTNAQIKKGKVYVNNGFWDTYRTAWPAYSMLYPKLAGELMDGFVQQYEDAGWIARWSSPGYADLMTGTSSDVAFADAYIKGAKTSDALAAYDAALKNATVLPTSSGVGRKGLDQSIFVGYTPASTGESVSWGLEGYINDYGIGQMAAKLVADPGVPAARKPQLREESKYFLTRAKQYVDLFDPSIGFFQAKNADGTFQQTAADYDPESWGGAYTETDGWNFAFHAPFDVAGLASLYGGTKGLVAKLDQFFATPEKADKPGGYGGTIHEMLEARDVRMGQLGMSNQVSHHIPYIYAAAGAPSKTQAAVREITRRLYVGSDIGQGYPGDEDNGEMSSWYLFSALGFYPLAMASDTYTIGSPLFTHAVVSPLGGKRLTIDAPANSTSNVYVKGATLNGKKLTSTTLSASAVAAGGTMTFDMAATPSNWGAKAPADEAVPTPLVDATKAGFGTASASDGTDVTALTDDNSRSAVTFATSDPTLDFDSEEGPVTVDTYTLTNGATGSSPTAWKLQGSSDGKTWVTVDKRAGQTWPSQTQTRPFQIKVPRALAHYRLVVSATTDGTAPTLSEVELLSDTTASPSGFTVSAKSRVAGTVGKPVSAPLAAVSGTTAATATATVDFLDGKGPQPATLTRSAIGAYEVALPHTFAEAGAYSVLVTATDGTRMASATSVVSVSRTAPSLTAAYDSTCLAYDGTGGNCDGLDNAFSAASLASGGFIGGTTIAVPGTKLTFDLPKIAAGKPDNATGDGQVLPLSLGDDVTRLSVIGTANEKPQDTVGTLTFADGSTAPMPIQFGDWTAAAANPQFGNVVVAKSAGRYNGGAKGDDAVAAIYATAPFSLPAGKKAVSLTLPVQTGGISSTGRIHVFAVASDGTRLATTPLAVKPAAAISTRATVAVSQTLATVSGGTAGTGAAGSGPAVTATVNWGDGTATTDAVVAKTGAITGSHTWATAGTYTVTVVADDGSGSASTTLVAHVAAAPVTYDSAIVATKTVHPGGVVTVTGSGFAPGEKVKLTVSGLGLPKSVVASAGGTFVVSGTVPKRATLGVYPVIATGVRSVTPATADVKVE